MKGQIQSKGGQIRNAAKSTRIPLTLKLLNDCYQNQISSIDGYQFSECYVIAKLMNQTLQANKELLTFQDGTYQLSVTRVNAQMDLTIGKYYRFFVSLSKALNQFRLYCRQVEQIQDMNMLNDHLAQTIARHLERTKGFIKR